MGRLTEAEKAEKVKWTKELRRTCPPGTRVYTVLQHVSRSGMMRAISCYVVKGREIVNITFQVGKVLEYRHHKDGGLKVGGCGMDMGFHLVNSLSYALHGMESKGKGASEEYFSDREANRKNYRAGYSLRQMWL
jgi:hypothetical protein